MLEVIELIEEDELRISQLEAFRGPLTSYVTDEPLVEPERILAVEYRG